MRLLLPRANSFPGYAALEHSQRLFRRGFAPFPRRFFTALAREAWLHQALVRNPTRGRKNPYYGFTLVVPQPGIEGKRLEKGLCKEPCPLSQLSRRRIFLRR